MAKVQPPNDIFQVNFASSLIVCVRLGLSQVMFRKNPILSP